MGSFRQSYINEGSNVMPYFYWISTLGCIGIRSYTKMQSYFSSPLDFYRASDERLKETGLFNEKQRNLIAKSKKVFDVEKEYDALLESKIRFIIRESEEFPERLKEIPQSPISLFIQGKLPDKSIPLVSIIGARNCSFYGTQVATRLGELFAEEGICVVSGMARGIDSLAQEACLKANGTSVAVLGGGVDVIYPPESGHLYDTLRERGAIISEYPPGTSPQPVFFAQRNRIISGLSDVLCVIEAKEKSGTMITVDAALEQGREVYALPGRITDSTSRGCNELIRQGAGIISDPEAFVTEISGNYRKVITEKSGQQKFIVSDYSPFNIEETRLDYETDSIMEQLNDAERKAIIIFDLDSFTPEQMAPACGIMAGELLIMCMNLSMKRILVNMGAGRFRLSEKGAKIRNKLLEI